MKTSLPKTITSDFLKRLSTLLHCINSIFKNINSGGCGHFALMLGEKLINHGYNPEIICLQKFINDDDIKQIKENFNLAPDELMELNQMGAYLNHIMIKCDGFYIDSTGIYKDISNIYPDFEELGVVSFDKLKSWCNCDDWNNTFDKKQLPKMERLINKYFDIEITLMKKFKIMVEMVG